MSRGMRAGTAVAVGFCFVAGVALGRLLKDQRPEPRWPEGAGRPLDSLRDAGATVNGEPGAGDDAYVEVVAAIVLGVSSAILAFWKLAGGGQGRRRKVWGLVLIFSFVLCAYGFGLLLELAAEGG